MAAPPAQQYHWFWNDYVWLPENLTWADFQSDEHHRYPQFHELSYSIVAGAILLVVRLVMETFVFLPIGACSGWVDTKKRVRMLYGDLVHGIL